MKKSDVVRLILESLSDKNVWEPKREEGVAYAPTNVALCKYWGKRDLELNLPVTSSLSIALPDRGAYTHLLIHDKAHDEVTLNGKMLEPDSPFVRKTIAFLDLFRPLKNWNVQVDIKMNVPVSAGLASSACGFASLTAALNDLFLWQLSKRQLSILARLGSGSAARSFWNGFVEWQAGIEVNGMDSYAEPLDVEWRELYVGILLINTDEKPLSSREAMQKTVDTSVLYNSWPKKVARDLLILRQAIHAKNFSLLGGASESNALGMHATMLSSWPPICYFLPETIRVMHQIWALRNEGVSLYFTQDAGPNLKLLFIEKDKKIVNEFFPTLDIVKTFE